jgi:regulator of sirC expression with transglutaminase-like and TPR domain
VASRSLRRFPALAAALTRRADAVSLAEAALALAADFHPRLDAAAYLARLDVLAEQAAQALRPTRDDAERVDALIEQLFEREGFRGNSEDYYDPRNSFLNDVLDRRVGIPITLALIYVEVGRRCRLPVQGIAFPGHFLVRFDGEDGDFLIDAFFGRTVTDDECEERLRAVLGPEARFDRQELRPATCGEVVVRMLANLKHAYARRRELREAIACCDRLLLLCPDAPAELRDRGLLYEELECWASALHDLERFLSLAPADPAAESVRERIETLRPRASRIH